jgi:hypothetical protein
MAKKAMAKKAMAKKAMAKKATAKKPLAKSKPVAKAAKVKRWQSACLHWSERKSDGPSGPFRVALAALVAQLKAANDNHLKDAAAIEELRKELRDLRAGVGRRREGRAGARWAVGSVRAVTDLQKRRW